MDKLSEKLEGLGTAIGTDWTSDRPRMLLVKTLQRRRRRRTRALLVATAAAAMVIVGIVKFANRAQLIAPPPRAPLPAAVAQKVEPTPKKSTPPVSTPIRFEDGTQISGGAGLTIASASDQRIVVELASGKHRFQVPAKDGRWVEVRVAGMRFEAREGEFTAQRRAESVLIAVQKGAVGFSAQGNTGTVQAGAEREFDLTAAPVAPVSPPAATKPAKPKGKVVRRKQKSWREHARARNYREAHRMIKEKASLVRETAGDLLLAADAARLSGAPAAAVPYFSRFLKRFARDARAPLAAFTLGRIYLRELGKPAKAASSFARARKLAPKGALAEDALARQIEALAKARQPAKAKRLAVDYLKRYPKGRRVKMVKRYGRLDQ